MYYKAGNISEEPSTTTFAGNAQYRKRMYPQYKENVYYYDGIFLNLGQGPSHVAQTTLRAVYMYALGTLVSMVQKHTLWETLNKLQGTAKRYNYVGNPVFPIYVNPGPWIVLFP